MFDRQMLFPARAAVPLLLCLGVAVAGVAVNAIAAESHAAPLRCEIRTSSMNGMTTVEGLVHATAAVTGSYQLRILSSGSSGNSDIEQGGLFAAGPEGSVTLGQVTLGGGGSFDASLELTSDGTTVSCSQRIGAI